MDGGDTSVPAPTAQNLLHVRCYLSLSPWAGTGLHPLAREGCGHICDRADRRVCTEGSHRLVDCKIGRVDVARCFVWLSVCMCVLDGSPRSTRTSLWKFPTRRMVRASRATHCRSARWSFAAQRNIAASFSRVEGSACSPNNRLTLTAWVTLSQSDEQDEPRVVNATRDNEPRRYRSFQCISVAQCPPIAAMGRSEKAEAQATGQAALP